MSARNSLGWAWKPPAGTAKTLKEGNDKIRAFHKREAAKYVPVKPSKPQ